MKKIFPFIFLLTFSFTSCIEIVEEITIKQDNSGNIKYRIETNKITSLINQVTNFLDASLENQLKDKTSEIAKKIKSCRGISNVRYDWSVRKKGNLLEFDFANADDLNDAIYQLIGVEKNIFTPKYLKITSKSFHRNNFSPWIKKYLEKEKIEIPGEYLSNMITYKTIVHFPAEVKHFKGKNIKLLNDKKGLVQVNNLYDVLNNKTNVKIKSKQARNRI